MQAPQTHTLAIVSLVLGLIICVPGAGIAAIICGFIARSAISKDPRRYEGGGLALAGIILGFAHIALGVFYIVFVMILGIVGAAAGN
jgi:hypothetical protein